MERKITFSLFLMAFSLSTFLSIVGIIPVISEYFEVSITMAGLFVGLFSFILSVTGLFLPSYFSSYERKRFFIVSLLIFILSSFLQIFIDNFYLALAIRLVPAFFYSSAISISLTIMSELSPNNVNKVVLGVSSGTILGLSISTQIGLMYGYHAVNIWILLMNVLALVVIHLFMPKMEGRSGNRIININFIKYRHFMISVLFILCIGVAISIVYNYFSTILITLTNVSAGTLSIFLLANGLASIVGTSLFGHLINKKDNLAIAVYPLVFAGVIFVMDLEIQLPAFVFVLLIIFGLLDGSMHTISQYWMASSLREAPEFANGVYLFINNLNRTVGIFIGGILVDCDLYFLLFYTSMAFFLLASPSVTYRIKKYPNLK
jgi:predicted MFS family arabinose efflux permease